MWDGTWVALDASGARDRGVDVVAYACAVDEHTVRLEHRLPVRDDD